MCRLMASSSGPQSLTLVARRVPGRESRRCGLPEETCLAHTADSPTMTGEGSAVLASPGLGLRVTPLVGLESLQGIEEVVGGRPERVAKGQVGSEQVLAVLGQAFEVSAGQLGRDCRQPGDVDLALLGGPASQVLAQDGR